MSFVDESKFVTVRPLSRNRNVGKQYDKVMFDETCTQKSAWDDVDAKMRRNWWSHLTWKAEKKPPRARVSPWDQKILCVLKYCRNPIGKRHLHAFLGRVRLAHV